MIGDAMKWKKIWKYGMIDEALIAIENWPVP